MSERTREIQCPACSHKFVLAHDADLSNIVCPHCEANIAEDALKGESEIAAEIAPGFRPGQRLGNYVIRSLLGSGGMAVVFLGEQLSLNRQVAIKILPEKFAQNRLFVERFESEAAVLASLNHRNVVGVIDRGKSDNTYFIVMEFIDGETLKDRLKRKRRLPPEEIIPFALQSLDGLGYAHKRGIVHRDVKPGNIMIASEGDVKIADFGLAHLAKAQGGMDVTRENQAMGTLKYMAPEQLMSARHVDGRADLYAFGVCLYEMLTGKLPVGTFKTPSEIDPSLDMRWDDIVLKALKTEAEERYQRAEHFAEALRELQQTPRVTVKDEERAEEAAAEAATKPERLLPQCAKCGHESPVTARECEKCGASLDDLFEKCPSCGRINRMDVEICPRCDANLEVHRAEKLQTALAVLRKAKHLAAERNYRQAIAEARKLFQYHTREYARLRKQTTAWIRRIETRADRYEQRLYEAGRRMFAEHRFEAAVKTWAPLPPTYRDVAHLRKEVRTMRKHAEQALHEGARLLQSGEVQGAMEALEKALGFWPDDRNLRKRLTEARNRLGNLNLKKSFLRDARKAESAGKLHEALALVRRVLDLDPRDKTGLLLLKRLQEKRGAFYEEESARETRLLIQERHGKTRKRMSRAAVAALTTSFVVVALLALIFAVFLPARRSRREATAHRMLNQAESLVGQGFYSKAIRTCEDLVERYPETAAAARARDRAEAMRETSTAAHAACQAVDEEAHKETFESLDAAYRQFAEVAKVPPVSLVPTYVAYAESRRKQVRREIVEILTARAAAHETRGEWHAALAEYRLAAEKYEFTDPPVGPALKEAAERVSKCADLVEQARGRGEQNDWPEAYALCRQALDLVWADPAANDFLAVVAERLPPPEGMILVERGEYVVGGSEEHPRRILTLPRGYYVDRGEVTCAQFRAFVKTTGHEPPPGWTEDGFPKPGTENLPVVNVTPADAAAYAAWAGKQLPTEELWECAARGTNGFLYAWGNDWREGNAVLGFGPAPPNAATGDRGSPGATGMMGNVAEWTSTDFPAKRAEATPGNEAALMRYEGRPMERVRRFVVKGSSWAGTESGRPTVVLPADRESPDHSTILTPDTDSPDLAISAPSNLELVYRGVFGRPDQARIVVRKWVPEWNRWLESAFTAAMGETLGGIASFAVEGTDAQRRPVRDKAEVDLNTGCVAIEQDPASWLDVRDPAGVVRRLPLERGRQERITLSLSSRLALPPPPDRDIRDVAMLYSRMAGRADGRYLNVGFRCILPLWAPPSTGAPEEASEDDKKALNDER